MKNLLFIILIVTLAIVISACSGNQSPDFEMKYSAKEIVDQMVTEVEQPVQMELTEEEVISFYNIAPQKLEDFSIRVPMMNVKVNELAVIKVKDKKDLKEVEAVLKQRAESVIKQFEQYLPDQYEIAQNYKIVTKGNYLLLVISESADELIEVYNRLFTES